MNISEKASTILNAAKTKIPINEFDLIGECNGQSSQYQVVGESYVLAKANAKKQKLILEHKSAELSLSIRANPQAFGIAKLTVDIVNSTIAADANINQLKEILIQAECDMDAYKVMLDAFESRRSMLRDIVSMNHVDPTGYNSTQDNSEEIKKKILLQRKTK